MKKYIIILVLLSLSLLAVNAAAQENASRKLLTNISLDTDNRTGHLVYTELYYSVNSSGNLTYDTGRKYFEDNITSPRIRMQILRPLDKSGKPYPDNRIRAVATIDNKTILNKFYKINKPANTSSSKAANDTDADQPSGKKIPGFEIAAGLVPLILVVLYYKFRRKNKLN